MFVTVCLVIPVSPDNVFRHLLLILYWLSLKPGMGSQGMEREKPESQKSGKEKPESLKPGTRKAEIFKTPNL